MNAATFGRYTHGKIRPYAKCRFSRKECPEGDACRRLHGSWETMFDFLLAVERSDPHMSSVNVSSFFDLVPKYDPPAQLPNRAAHVAMLKKLRALDRESAASIRAVVAEEPVSPFMTESEFAEFTRDKWTGPYRLCPASRKTCRYGAECKKLHGSWGDLFRFLATLELELGRELTSQDVAFETFDFVPKYNPGTDETHVRLYNLVMSERARVQERFPPQPQPKPDVWEVDSNNSADGDGVVSFV